MKCPSGPNLTIQSLEDTFPATRHHLDWTVDKQLAEYNESPTSSDNQSHGHIYLQTFVQFNNVIEELYRISSKNSI